MFNHVLSAGAIMLSESSLDSKPLIAFAAYYWHLPKRAVPMQVKDAIMRLRDMTKNQIGEILGFHPSIHCLPLIL